MVTVNCQFDIDKSSAWISIIAHIWLDLGWASVFAWDMSQTIPPV